MPSATVSSRVLQAGPKSVITMAATVEDAAEKLQYDLYYVKNNSLFLDLVILFKTVVVVITGKGAQ